MRQSESEQPVAEFRTSFSNNEYVQHIATHTRTHTHTHTHYEQHVKRSSFDNITNTQQLRQSESVQPVAAAKFEAVGFDGQAPAYMIMLWYSIA